MNIHKAHSSRFPFIIVVEKGDRLYPFHHETSKEAEEFAAEIIIKGESHPLWDFEGILHTVEDWADGGEPITIHNGGE